MRRELNDRYFEWLRNKVCKNRHSDKTSFNNLFIFLHEVEFTYLIPNDDNRAEDGISLRWRFCCETGEDYDKVERFINGPCSVLEMMVALSIACEELMDDPQYGNRTGQWFWMMISNLGLGSMYDSRFDRSYAEGVIEKFLNREYEPNGKGGLFVIRNCDYDLRKIEIWYQLCWYLDSIL